MSRTCDWFRVVGYRLINDSTNCDLWYEKDRCLCRSYSGRYSSSDSIEYFKALFNGLMLMKRKIKKYNFTELWDLWINHTIKSCKGEFEQSQKNLILKKVTYNLEFLAILMI